MPESLLSALKYVFLGLLYLFFLRVIRAVWVELREPTTISVSVPAGAGRGTARFGPQSGPGTGPAGPVPGGGAGVGRRLWGSWVGTGAGAGAGSAGSAGGHAGPGSAAAWGSHLVVREPADRVGQTFPLGEELTLGRAAGCGISLPEDTFVSTLHARVFRRDGALWVEDLGSTNGTFVNDRQVTSAVGLRRGDRLQVGRTILELAQ